jgi:hypothetical protein
MYSIVSMVYAVNPETDVVQMALAPRAMAVQEPSTKE